MAADHDLVPIASPDLSATISPSAPSSRASRTPTAAICCGTAIPPSGAAGRPSCFRSSAACRATNIASTAPCISCRATASPGAGPSRSSPGRPIRRPSASNPTTRLGRLPVRFPPRHRVRHHRRAPRHRRPLTNPSERPLSASFGYHPAFRWPLPYGAPRAAHTIRFEHEEPEPIRQLNATGQIEAAPRDNPLEGRTLALRDSLFEADALVFEGLKSHRVVYGAPGAPVLEVDFPRMPDLGIWTKPARRSSASSRGRACPIGSAIAASSATSGRLDAGAGRDPGVRDRGDVARRRAGRLRLT